MANPGGQPLNSRIIDAILPWRIDVNPLLGPVGVIGAGMSYKTVSASAVTYTYNGGGALNDAYGYDVVLAAGTWTLLFFYEKLSAGGIITPSIGGTNVGSTVDTYAAAQAESVVANITGITVPSTGKKRLLFTALGKNASSTGYFMALSAITLVRTA